jgi:ubiquinone/menaquinone biosynthesis C-methylase UbiE
VFGQLAALADPTRSRILLLLEGQALSVSAACSVLQLPQSTVSRHLKVLSDEGWVTVRADGASRLYRLGALDLATRKLWQAVRDEVFNTAPGQQDAQRLRTILVERRSRSTEFFSSAVAEWDAMRRELFGAQAEVLPLLALLDETWVVGDLGCGTGPISEALAPFVGRVIAVDASDAMIEVARGRLAEAINVELRSGQLEDLPIAEEQLDIALLILVLHHVVDPARVLAEARRVLKPGGRLLVVDMMPHAHDEYRETMGHLWQGFSKRQLAEWFEAAGFGAMDYVPLPPDPQAKGPSLFAARGRRS